MVCASHHGLQFSDRFESIDLSIQLIEVTLYITDFPLQLESILILIITTLRVAR